MTNKTGARIITRQGSFPLERLLFGNDDWRSHRAINEIDVYCDLLENVQDMIDSLETRGEGEEAALTNVQAVLSSYALEIAMNVNGGAIMSHEGGSTA